MNVKQIETLYLDRKYTIKETADRLGISFWKLYDVMRKKEIPRRNYSEANYAKYDRYKPRFLIKEKIDLKNRYLKIAGIMLYWAEGSKNSSGVDFVNSDPEMIQLFLAFLRQICGVDESRLRVYLYAYEHQNINNLKNFWGGITQIPLTQFTKPYVRKGNPNLNTDKMPKGLIHVRYYDKKLLQVILNWIKEYISSFK